MSASGEKAEPRSKRVRPLTVILLVITVATIALSVALAFLFTVPLKSVERSDVVWFGASLRMSGGPPLYSVGYYLGANAFYGPADVSGNVSVSVLWQSSSPV